MNHKVAYLCDGHIFTPRTPSFHIYPIVYSVVCCAFHVQGNILSGFPAILPSQIILPSGDAIAVSEVAVVRIRYNKTSVDLFTIDSKYYPRTRPRVILLTAGEQFVILP